MVIKKDIQQGSLKKKEELIKNKCYAEQITYTKIVPLKKTAGQH